MSGFFVCCIVSVYLSVVCVSVWVLHLPQLAQIAAAVSAGTHADACTAALATLKSGGSIPLFPRPRWATRSVPSTDDASGSSALLLCLLTWHLAAANAGVSHDDSTSGGLPPDSKPAVVSARLCVCVLYITWVAGLVSCVVCL